LSAFKNITNSDVALIPYVASKQYQVDITDPNVYHRICYDTPSIPASYNSYDLYNVIKRGYYPNFISGSLEGVPQRLLSNNYISASYDQPSSSYVDYRDISYDVSYISSSIQVVSIPQSYYGEGIKPGSVFFTIQQYNSGTIGYDGNDDKHGNLIIFDSYLNKSVYIGNIFYSQGLVVITDSNYFFEEVDFGGDFSISFLNTLTIYEQTFRLKIKQHEFNYSYNPTLLVSGSSSQLQPFSTTGSFQPYITSVGLYNSNSELMAIAKLGQPLPMSANTDYNINIKLDW